jgi:hypothetical protein
MVRERLFGVLVLDVLDVTEVGVAADLGEPVGGFADGLFTQLGLLGYIASWLKGVNERGKSSGALRYGMA